MELELNAKQTSSSIFHKTDDDDDDDGGDGEEDVGRSRQQNKELKTRKNDSSSLMRWH